MGKFLAKRIIEPKGVQYGRYRLVKKSTLGIIILNRQTTWISAALCVVKQGLWVTSYFTDEGCPLLCLLGCGLVELQWFSELVHKDMCSLGLLLSQLLNFSF